MGACPRAPLLAFLVWFTGNYSTRSLPAITDHSCELCQPFPSLHEALSIDPVSPGSHVVIQNGSHHAQPRENSYTATPFTALGKVVL